MRQRSCRSSIAYSAHELVSSMIEKRIPLRMIGECSDSRAEQREAPSSNRASRLRIGRTHTIITGISYGCAASMETDWPTIGQVSRPSFVSISTMRHEQSKKLEQASQECAIHLRPSTCLHETRPYSTDPGPDRRWTVWPVRSDETCHNGRSAVDDMGLGLVSAIYMRRTAGP